ncbi:hypothetical protein LCGC14_0691130 [marine sediment metagenome]|uniref:Uncharacterized protein n=1 Tax=marine sediment metagenome TaxID=412755 RepID=A0A0F9R5S1_9ZZZZ
MKIPKELRDKRDLGGTITKNRECSIRGCRESAIRSLSENSWKKYIEKAGMKFKENSNHKIYLCKQHYNQTNKFRKTQEKLFQKKGFLDNHHATKVKKGMLDY